MAAFEKHLQNALQVGMVSVSRELEIQAKQFVNLVDDVNLFATTK
jgi:hypothetical protein